MTIYFCSYSTGTWNVLCVFQPFSFDKNKTNGSVDADEEAKQWGLAMAKCRQVHTNTTKISLRIKEELNKPPCTAAHGEVIKQLTGAQKNIDDMCSQYEVITISGRIPNITEPTTSSLLRKKIVEENGATSLYSNIKFPNFVFFQYQTPQCYFLTKSRI